MTLLSSEVPHRDKYPCSVPWPSVCDDLSLGDLLGNGTVGLDDDLVDVEGGLDGLGLLVDPFELFEGTTLRFDTVTVMLVPFLMESGRTVAYPNMYQQAVSIKSHPTNTQR